MLGPGPRAYCLLQKPLHSRWLNPSLITVPLRAKAVQACVRLRDGLPPLPALPVSCPLCGDDVKGNLWHCLSCVKLRRHGILLRHNFAVKLLIRYARSHSCLAHEIEKDKESLLPDGVIHLSHKSIFFDVSGVSLFAHSYRHLPPGDAIRQRESSKIGKYALHAKNANSSFVPFIIDCFGSLGKRAMQLIDEIAEESLALDLGSPPPDFFSKTAFLSALSRSWQLGNANILREWSRRSRDLISKKRGLQAPAAH